MGRVMGGWGGVRWGSCVVILEFHNKNMAPEIICTGDEYSPCFIPNWTGKERTSLVLLVPQPQ
jgi:hypothetical protein